MKFLTCLPIRFPIYEKKLCTKRERKAGWADMAGVDGNFQLEVIFFYCPSACEEFFPAKPSAPFFILAQGDWVIREIIKAWHLFFPLTQKKSTSAVCRFTFVRGNEWMRVSRERAIFSLFFWGIYLRIW